MRLDRLDLVAYGPFTNVSIDFDRAAGLHVVFGPNEAGKSSALRAVGDLLDAAGHALARDVLDPFLGGATATSSTSQRPTSPRTCSGSTS